MKSLLETLALILLVAFCLAMFFLFAGKPSLWDQLHARAIASTAAREVCTP